MDAILSSIPGVTTYLDDILIVATSLDQLRERTTAVLQRVSDNGFRLRSEKCQLFLKSVKYLGFIFDVALALVFAVRRFHKFLYGRRFTLITGHKPLLTMFGSKSGVPAHFANRLQRWALVLLGYDFDIHPTMWSDRRPVTTYQRTPYDRRRCSYCLSNDREPRAMLPDICCSCSASLSN
ncbi:uncharacterized protein DC041_0005572 [Schistosoma bovis]|uniref:Reverse transcriptase domain-containing protein n=1 Tax=Schistosoma bovis TaxID=6184 RepID=A0A430QKL8_SCHBO|nr:uncharacterized protein DC041_0005572 [Schistosoma bovis]